MKTINRITSLNLLLQGQRNAAASVNSSHNIFQAMTKTNHEVNLTKEKADQTEPEIPKISSENDEKKSTEPTDSLKSENRGKTIKKNVNLD